MEQLKIDLRNLDLLELKAAGILPRDLDDLFIIENSEIHSFGDFLYAIGYIKQTKFIYAAYNVSKNVNFDIAILQAGIPNEEDIKRYWCKGKGKRKD